MATVGAMAFSVCAFGLLVGIVMLGSAGLRGSRADEFSAGWDAGGAFASGRTISECVSEVQRRGASECTNVLPLCDIGFSAFTGACIAAAIDDGYCAPVPDSSELEASDTWKRSACAATPARWCDILMRDIQSACENRNERATEDATTEDDATDPD